MIDRDGSEVPVRQYFGERIQEARESIRNAVSAIREFGAEFTTNEFKQKWYRDSRASIGGFTLFSMGILTAYSSIKHGMKLDPEAFKAYAELQPQSTLEVDPSAVPGVALGIGATAVGAKMLHGVKRAFFGPAFAPNNPDSGSN